MDLSYVKKIIKLVENSSIDELELEEQGAKIKVAKNRNNGVVTQTFAPMPMMAPQAASIALPQPAEAAKSAAPSTAPVSTQYHEIRSPIVGTFYRAPAPDAEVYTEVGQVVKVGTVLCIVEAMKLMNEIESDCNGTIVKIMVENGKPVEYNQVLFLVDKA